MRTAPSLFNHVSGLSWYLTTYLALVAVPPLLWTLYEDDTVPRRRKMTGILISAALLSPPVMALFIIFGAGALR